MAQVILEVPGISCEHCERTIVEALSPRAGVQSVSVSIPGKQVQVAYDPAQIDVAQMREILLDEEYPVASERSGESATN